MIPIKHEDDFFSLVVIPVLAKAGNTGIKNNYLELLIFHWIPAFAGMTMVCVAEGYLHVQRVD